MFVGHLGVALVAKRAEPSVNLGWLVAAAMALDLVWPILLLAGIESVRIVPGATAFNALVFESYPWSHSLLASAVWGGALAAVARWRDVSTPASRLLVALVTSHWVLDYISHAPDLPLWPGRSPRFGLGLWNSVAWTFLVEGTIWAAGIAVYLRTRRLSGWISRLAFWSLVVVATAMWAIGPWAPPPPSPEALGWFGLIGFLLVPWAALAERSAPVVRR